MWQVTATVLSGVTILVLGQALVKFVIEPLHDFRKLKGEITDALIFYANIYLNPNPSKVGDREYLEAEKTLRQLAGKLTAIASAIPMYGICVRLRLVPKWEDVIQARGNLIGLSNALYTNNPDDRNSRKQHNIVKLLGLRIGD